MFEKLDNLWCFESDSEAATAKLGRAIANAISPGDVIALVGDLGTGKTRLVQSIAEELGVNRDDVNSPTFVLIQHYDATIPLHHIDAYRLRDEDEFIELGVDELMGGDGATLIEWADRVQDALPLDALWIIGRVTDQNEREFSFRGQGKAVTTIQRVSSNL
ncbi:MAG: tRNA (adenosine(37)-N6)-threonylcarbamoyltransferase complex ATPase subunit type 1 TsaE [Planctomycetaceae bacterium]|nr:tRNA (adenosine(37)-N6)-threonylcarbamoyltransferase complex ATPase subunit type 1 TsaE [Planctomycetaceae bacterium]